MLENGHSPWSRAIDGPWLKRFTFPALLIAVLLMASDSRALIRFDFEGPYLLDAGRSIKDHTMVWHDGLWHCFYIRGDALVSGTSTEKELGHATSPDLRTWMIRSPVIVNGAPGEFDERNVWAPHVIAPQGAGPWQLFYTGANSSVVQRLGRATSVDNDLSNWFKDFFNPILEPSTPTWDWAPAQDFSSFRDPFLFHDGNEWVMLHTAALVDSTIPAGRRGAIHRVTSPDMVNWVETTPIAIHNGSSSVAWHDLESVQLHFRAGEWHLFFTEQNNQGIRYQRSAQPDSGWSIDTALLLDQGTAVELTDDPVEGITRFSRHAATQPSGTDIEWLIRIDNFVFDGQSSRRETWDVLAEDWPIRSGIAFGDAPTYGDNSAIRGDIPSLPDGHGFLSSREYYRGPLGGIGAPGGQLGTGATGHIESRVFTIEGEFIDFLVGGGTDPDCYVALVDAVTGIPILTELGPGSNTLVERRWDVSALVGQDVRIEVHDGSTGPNGWIAVDRIIEHQLTAAPAALPMRTELFAPWPNPANPRSLLQFRLSDPARAQLLLVDLRGRIIRSWPGRELPAGVHEQLWDGLDQSGAPVASGTYRPLLRTEDGTASGPPVVLIR